MGLLVSSRLPPNYESEARLLVGPLSGNRDVIQGAGEQARTYAAVATTAQIVNPVAVRFDLSPSALKGKLDVTSSDVTRLLSVRVNDGNAARAASIANAVVDELGRFAGQGGIQTSPEGELRVVERATPATSPTGPSANLIVPLAALAGLLGALGLASLVDALSTTVRSEHELAQVAPVAVLGSLDGARGNPGGRPVVETNRNSRAAAAYRVLAAKVELADGERPLRSVVVVDTQEGRSGAGLAANLAIALAEGRGRVALVDSSEGAGVISLYGVPEDDEADGDLRQGRPFKVGRLMLERFRVEGSRVVIVRPRDDEEPLEPAQAAEILERVLVDVDFAVVVVPPLNRSPNSLVWSRAAQGTLLVTERDRTRREQVPAAVESLRLAGANVIGVVLCGFRTF